ncbi:hypothetical protein OO013_10015 [Mangrovivirga sp. M17]|uniref:Uncharacterized protein n=1 Tax=Mangrovivirga halotolerans TaxID=2993936 RepID=A0ABT3RSI2_9BACT|nr:hypothetical protein [Mangrovivirga halotolerans]MCX2744202.1 hypothetical protein [Mangrovivirga halotolerans]
MRTFLGILLWLILLAICWPLALLVFFLFPIVWVLSLPFTILGLSIELAFDLLKELIMLPFKILNMAFK